MLIVNVTYIMIILFFLIVLYLKLTFGFDCIMKCEGIEKEVKWHNFVSLFVTSLILWKQNSILCCVCTSLAITFRAFIWSKWTIQPVGTHYRIFIEVLELEMILVIIFSFVDFTLLCGILDTSFWISQSSLGSRWRFKLAILCLPCFPLPGETPFIWWAFVKYCLWREFYSVAKMENSDFVHMCIFMGGHWDQWFLKAFSGS